MKAAICPSSSTSPPSLLAGENLLVVRVVDASDDRSRYPECPFTEVPHGKQSWYGPIGGIWQSVWLEARPKLHIITGAAHAGAGHRHI